MNMTEKDRTHWWHWQNLNEDRRGKVKGRPWRGRAWFHVLNESARVEWNLFSNSCHASVEFEGPGGDDTVTWSVAFPPIALYFGLNVNRTRLLSRLADRICVAVRDMGSKYSGAEFRIAVHDWAVWWDLGVDNTGWTNERPRWRDGNFQVLDFLLGKPEYTSEVAESGPIQVCMPEGSYEGACEIKRDVWSRPRWPAKVIYRAHVDMKQPVPVPGKGENSWDCDENAIFGSTFPARNFAEATAGITASALKSRQKHGGLNWVPERKKAG